MACVGSRALSADSDMMDICMLADLELLMKLTDMIKLVLSDRRDRSCV